MNIIVPNKPSRSVRWTDLPRVFRDSWRIKVAMMKPFPGRYPKASSISHCQIEAEDPLRFFVLGDSWHVFEGSPMKLKKFFGFPWARTIINPDIIEGHGQRVKSQEGCMSFPDTKTRRVKRWEIVDCRFWTFWGRRTKRLYLYRAAVVQHEVDHMDAVTTEDHWMHAPNTKGRE